jgi:hypothetical protein
MHEELFVFHPELVKRKTNRQRRRYADNVNLAVAPYMYLTDPTYDSLHSSAPTLDSQRIYVHEYRHIQRQLAFPVGVKIWWLIYEHFPKFRLNEELVAIEAELLFYAMHHLEYPIDEKSESLSSDLYQHMIDYEESKKLITSMWNNTLSGMRERS